VRNYADLFILCHCIKILLFAVLEKLKKVLKVFKEAKCNNCEVMKCIFNQSSVFWAQTKRANM